MQWYHYIIIAVGLLFISYYLISYLIYLKVFIKFNKYPKKLVDHESEFYKDSYDWFQTSPKEDVYIRSYDSYKLHGFYLPSLDKNSNNLAIIIHGYQSKATDMIIIAKLYSDLGFKVLLIDLRRHGESEGKFTSMGHYEKYDLKKWINFASRNYGANSKILLHGVSMGAAMSILVTQLKVRANIKFLVLDSGFTVFSKSLSESAKPKILRLFIPGVSVFTYLFHRFTLRQINPLNAIKHSHIPFLIIHGDKDKPVPVSMAQELFDKSPIGKKHLLIVEGSSHAKGFEVNKDQVTQTIIDNIADEFKIKKAYIKNF